MSTHVQKLQHEQKVAYASITANCVIALVKCKLYAYHVSLAFHDSTFLKTHIHCILMLLICNLQNVNCLSPLLSWILGSFVSHVQHQIAQHFCSCTNSIMCDLTIMHMHKNTEGMDYICYNSVSVSVVYIQCQKR